MPARPGRLHGPSDQRRATNSHKELKRMALYENVFIARQDISATQVDALADGFTTLIAEQGGQVTKREYWGLRNISYRIKQNRERGDERDRDRGDRGDRDRGPRRSYGDREPREAAPVVEGVEE